MIDFFQLLPLPWSMAMLLVCMAVIVHPLVTDYWQCLKSIAVVAIGVIVGVFALVLIGVMIARELLDTP